MAWNEPGGDDKKDPWGNKEGPPDLDEAFRRFRDRLGGAFGGGGGGGGAGISGSVFALVLALAALFWGYMGVYVIDERERGVVLRFGKYLEILEPGFNWNPAGIDQVTVVNVTGERQYTSSGMMLTEDENIVELPLTVHYFIIDVRDFVLNVKTPEISLREATDAALRHVVGSSSLDMVLGEGRQQIASDVKTRLQRYLNNYGTGIEIIKVNIQEAKPPAEVKSAFDDVVKAKEDEQRLKEQAQAYANGMIPEARGRAQRQLEEAAAYLARVIAEAEGEARRFEKLLTEYQKAPKVTRERLYLDALQQVMANTSKVMVGGGGGSNVLYLPLDKIVNQGANSTRRSGSVGDDETVQRTFDRVMERLRQESTASRRREDR